MTKGSKLIISIIALVCIVALMATGVHAATSASFSIVNSVAYIFVPQKITVTCYAGNPTGVPVIDSKKIVQKFEMNLGSKINTGVIIGGIQATTSTVPLATKATNPDYNWLGWFTYNFDTNEYVKQFKKGMTPKATEIVNNQLILFEQYGYLSETDGSVKLDDHGLVATVDSTGTNTTISVQPAPGATKVTIPSTVIVDGVEVPITELKPGGDWSDVTSLDMKDSQITELDMGAIGTNGGGDVGDPTQITSLVLPDGLLALRGDCMNNLASLTYLVIPMSVIIIEENSVRLSASSNCTIYVERTWQSGQNIGWGSNLFENDDFAWGLGAKWEYDINGVPKKK